MTVYLVHCLHHAVPIIPPVAYPSHRAIDKAVFDERRSNLLIDIRVVEDKLASLEEDHGEAHKHMFEFLKLAGSLSYNYISAPPLEKRDLIKEVTSKRLVSGKNLTVELREPYATIANRSKLPKCGHYQDTPRTHQADKLISFLSAYRPSSENLTVP